MTPIHPLPIALAVLVSGCSTAPPPVPVAQAPQVFRTLDGKVFATRAERRAYLDQLDVLHDREAHRVAQNRLAIARRSLGGLQAERRRLRIERALRAANATEMAQSRANARAADALRALRTAEREAAHTTRAAHSQALAAGHGPVLPDPSPTAVGLARLEHARRGQR